MAAEVIMRVPVDISIPTPSTDEVTNGTESKGKDKEETNGQSDLDMIFAASVVDEADNLEKKAWSEWEDKVLKIINVCKDYGLEEVLYSVCRVSRQH